MKKHVLSIILTLAMTASLLTVYAGATDFTDDDEILYKEAVGVLSTIEVINGYEDKSFRPEGTLSRGAAAKIICNLILSPAAAEEKLDAASAPFPDVPADHAFAGYITYCAKEGIVSGYADGNFEPSGTLSGYAFVKMLLGALGYRAETEGYVGDNWSENVIKRARDIGLDEGLQGAFAGEVPITRQEACLFACNALKAGPVEYD